MYLLPCCVKSSFRIVFSLSFGKIYVDAAQDELFFLLFVCVVFCLSCKVQNGFAKAFPNLWEAVKLRGLLVQDRLQRPQPQTPQPHSGSNSSSIPVTLVQQKLTKWMTLSRRLVKAISKSKRS